MQSTITSSVGDWRKQAANRDRDVRTVQELLETVAVVAKMPRYDPSSIDGRIARPPRTSRTVDAICAFQSRFMREPDGLVQPGKLTISKLNELARRGQPNTEIPVMKVPAAGETPNFPLPFVPQASYKGGQRWFGARRDKGQRKHAGCDLIAREGTPVHAVDDGVIVRGPTYFYRGTYAIEVRHTNFVARYCEIKGTAAGLRRGSRVERGQLLAYVGKMWKDSMLHFEMYDGTATGPLTQRGDPRGYKRRSDLLNPTPYLDIWATNLPS